MRLSQYYLPLQKNISAEIKRVSHQYSIRAGLVKQNTSGIYTVLPLGLRVMNNISNLIRKTMEDISCIELLMPCIQDSKLWEQSERYDAYGKELLKIKDRHGHEMLFGPTNEELIVDNVNGYLNSYKNMPLSLHHIQWKFRDEIRPRFGLLRAREFLMHDAYSFDIDQEALEVTYKKFMSAYIEILTQIDLPFVIVKANAGEIGGNLSHEFILLAKDGENTIYYDRKIFDYINNKNTDKIINCFAKTDEMIEQSKELVSDEMARSQGIEVGHIFAFGTKYSQSLKLKYLDNNGRLSYPYMGSYGIGVSRLLAAIIEASHDEDGIIWPKSIAPYKYGIISQKNNLDASLELYNTINSLEKDQTLIDDTGDNIGMKFVKMDLIGLPYQVLASKNYSETKIIEIKERATGKKHEIHQNNFSEFMNKLS